MVGAGSAGCCADAAPVVVGRSPECKPGVLTKQTGAVESRGNGGSVHSASRLMVRYSSSLIKSVEF